MILHDFVEQGNRPTLVLSPCVSETPLSTAERKESHVAAIMLRVMNTYVHI
jgi:hypothetical protein